jgi:hypothetical protein
MHNYLIPCSASASQYHLVSPESYVQHDLICLQYLGTHDPPRVAVDLCENNFIYDAHSSHISTLSLTAPSTPNTFPSILHPSFTTPYWVSIEVLLPCYHIITLLGRSFTSLLPHNSPPRTPLPPRASTFPQIISSLNTPSLRCSLCSLRKWDNSTCSHCPRFANGN